jgi:lauroyl/myristoyl acyltransferase
MTGKRLFTLGRRWVMTAGMHGTLSLGRLIGPGGANLIGAFASGAASRWPGLRRRLLANWQAAGLQAGPELADNYFRNFARWVSWSTAVYARGFEESGVAAKIEVDDSFARVDEAVAKGKGVILACPHFFCHELAAAAINLRHPVVALVRESKSSTREAMKKRWYQSTGMKIVKRPRRASLMADTISTIRSLRDGAILGITPDVIMPPEKGIAVRMFGRQVFLSPGIVALSLRVGSPVIVPVGRWVYGRSLADDRAVLSFDHLDFGPGKASDPAHIQRGLQRWCALYEERLRERPDYWMFWLDKNWTRVFQRSE